MPDSLLPNLELPGGAQIVQLEHVNFNVGEEWTEELEGFYFYLLGAVPDIRAPEVHEITTRAGGRQLGLRWANLGFQQFHLPLVAENAYSDVFTQAGIRWSHRQHLDGVIEVEVREDAFAELGRRLNELLARSDAFEGLQTIEESSPRTTELFQGSPDSSEDYYSKSLCVEFRGTKFVLRAQPKAVFEAGDTPGLDYHWIGPKFPLPVTKHRNPLPSGLLPTVPGYTNFAANSSGPSGGPNYALGIRRISYGVRSFARNLLGQKTSIVSINPLKSIAGTYDMLFGEGTARLGGENGDEVQVAIGHARNPQVLRFFLDDNGTGERQNGDGEFKRESRYDGHHIAIYVNDFLQTYCRARRFHEALGRKGFASGLVWENPAFPQFTYRSKEEVLKFNEFRFKDFLDFDADPVGLLVFELEHEVRSLKHPGFWLNKDIFLGKEKG